MVSKLIQRMRMMKNEELSMKNSLNKRTFVAIELETLKRIEVIHLELETLGNSTMLLNLHFVITLLVNLDAKQDETRVCKSVVAR